MKRAFFHLVAILPFVGFMVYSYTQVDPNLVISSFPPYWNLQQQLWQIGYHQRNLSSVLFGVLVMFMSVSVVGVLRFFTEQEKKRFFISVILVLIFSYNALSHDIFNYLFNARMVVMYQTNPHTHIALEFPNDDWTRFMHNTHTPAPYGYGWTVLSLLPYVIGFGKFNPSYYAMKILIVGGFLLMWWAVEKLAKMVKSDTAQNFHTLKWLFFLNPLVLIETFSNGHNDVWMMGLALLSYVFVLKIQQKDSLRKKVGYVFMAIVILAISASVKFATLILAPVLIFLIITRLINKLPSHLERFAQWWPEMSAVLLFLPLLTDRSQQFHPWYLIWSLSFLPFIRSVWIRYMLIAFSFSSLFRYLPYLYLGNYTTHELTQEKIITWVGGVFVLFGLMLCRKWVSRVLK
ncbi:MAG: hypothetical protein AAB612_01005 [Patescibacteria group bacterium]